MKLILDPSNKSDEVSLKKTLSTDCGQNFDRMLHRDKILFRMLHRTKFYFGCCNATPWHYLCTVKCHSSKFNNTLHICDPNVHTLSHPCTSTFKIDRIASFDQSSINQLLQQLNLVVGLLSREECFQFLPSIQGRLACYNNIKVA